MRALHFASTLLAIAFLAVALSMAGPAVSQSHDELKALNTRVIELYRAGKYGEAVPLAERYAAGMKVRHGADAPQYATALNNLARLLRATNRLGEAEPLYRRALAIDEKGLGPEHPNAARDLNNLALVLRETNRLGEAEPLFRRALAIYVRAYHTGRRQPWIEEEENGHTQSAGADRAQGHQSIVGALLLGSVPGIYLGSHLSAHVSDRILFPALASMMLLIGLRLIAS